MPCLIDTVRLMEDRYCTARILTVDKKCVPTPTVIETGVPQLRSEEAIDTLTISCSSGGVRIAKSLLFGTSFS